MANRGTDGGSSPHKETLYKQYATYNTRYKNKIKKAEKRYKNCPKCKLKDVKSKIVKHHKRYKKER